MLSQCYVMLSVRCDAVSAMMLCDAFEVLCHGDEVLCDACVV
jgi:hypothetical protein